MIIQRMRHSKLLRIAAIVSLLLTAALPYPGSAVQAGREGVFISDSAYFALKDATLSPGADDQMLRFGVELVNDSDSPIDFNKYGVRIVASDGSSYGADLSERSVARVLPGGSGIFRYIAHIPAGVSADSLKVDLFAWDFSRSDYMNDLGMLSVGAVAQTGGSNRQSVILNMNDADASYPSDALVSFELIRSYKALSNGSWYLYSDIVAENMSGTSLKLPSGLQYFLKDEDGLSYAASLAYGGDQTILPHQRVQLGMQAAIGTAGDVKSFMLEFDKKTVSNGSGSSTSSGTTGSSSGNSGSNGSSGQNSNGTSSAGTTYTALGKLDLSRSVQLNAVGESASYASKEAAALTLVADHVTSALKSDGIHVDAEFTAKNETMQTLAVPSFDASYQLTQSTLAVAAADTVSSHPAFLPAGESTTYRFAGVLPKGVDPSAVQLAVFEKKPVSPAVSVPVNITQLSGSIDTSGSGTPSGILTSVGSLSLTLKSTYRMMTETGDDVLMSEISVQNTDSKIVSLPSAAAFYGGHMLGDFDAQGKAIRLQSSSYLIPGQKTTVYVYSKIPYSTVVDSGYAYIGDGTFNNTSGVWTQKNEWTELPFTNVASGTAQTALGTEWFIPDAGRMATGKIAESKVYDNGTQKTVAVRVAQTNKETRNGANVPYIGYVTDSNGGVWSLKATEEAGKLCKECQALTTLWTTVPSAAVTNGGLQVVFGQKVDDIAFASAQQYAFQVSPETGSAGGSSISSASLYPYTVSVQNAKWSSGANTISISFDYMQTKTADMTGASKNRSLEFALVDGSGNVLGTAADYLLEGTGSGAVNSPIPTGTNKTLTFTLGDINQLISFVNNPRMAVYEKFEGGVRLIGILTPST